MWDYEYLQDFKFLRQFDAQQSQTQYIKLTVLDLNNTPLEYIEGKATGGNVSVNGSSAIRRSGSLSLIADESNYRITELENIIYMNKKVQVEVGFTNTTNQYLNHDIIWFPQGVFVMSGANIQKNNSGITISLTLKDQMSLLNGECGGVFETAVTHSPAMVERIFDNDSIVSEEPVLFYQLIYRLLTEWGHLPPEYIIIEDVPLTIENIVRWQGEGDIFFNPVVKDGNVISYTMSQNPDSGDIPAYSYGDAVGYLEIDYSYPTANDLTSNAGETITSVLDKIKSALGNYEYFFDVQGFFHFQKIKDYVDEGVGLSDLAEALAYDDQDYIIEPSHKSIYDFSTAQLINSYSNAPAWGNIKNDFVIWGKKSDTNASLRYHLIIDEIPNHTFTTDDKVYQYQDAFGVWRFEKSEEGALNKSAYAIRYALKNVLMTTPVDIKNPNDPTKIDDQYILTLDKINVADWRIKAYFYAILHPGVYYYSAELIEEIPKIFDLQELNNLNATNPNPPFVTGVTPATLSYWIDIIYAENLAKFTVSNIGKRTKAIVDDKINCLFTPTFPDVMFLECSTEQTAAKRKEYRNRGKAFYQMPKDSIGKLLGIGMITNSAYDHLRAQIHTLLSFNESVSIGIIPIYHLEPNTRIAIEDKDTNIKGDYMIKSFSVPLAPGGTMTLQCSKAVERI